MDLKKNIIDEGHKQGFDMVYFTDCHPFTNIESYLRLRRKNKRETSFEEEDIQKRIDPKKTLSNCKSIIVLAMSYNSDYKVEDNPLSGSLSRSSWGDDYHRVIGKKMESLIEELKKTVNFQYKAFVDTGPLVDRELAKRSGLGYYGKNCSIINREYGSFIFLSYILTDLEIKIDELEIDDNCGDCDLCIRACPTGALESAYKLNPKKCISYLSQSKDIIPEELRGKMGREIYGCDRCQIVCPKNKAIKIPNHEEFIPRNTGGLVDIEELLSMSNREFKNKYGHMAASWRGKNILKRNAIIALGNMGNQSSLSLLLEEKKKEDPNFKDYINWGISKEGK